MGCDEKRDWPLDTRQENMNLQLLSRAPFSVSIWVMYMQVTIHEIFLGIWCPYSLRCGISRAINCRCCKFKHTTQRQVTLHECLLRPSDKRCDKGSAAATATWFQRSPSPRPWSSSGLTFNRNFVLAHALLCNCHTLHYYTRYLQIRMQRYPPHNISGRKT